MELTAIYASPNARIRRSLWSRLDELRIEDPWVLFGDFNCMVMSKERSSIGGISSSFQAWVN